MVRIRHDDPARFLAADIAAGTGIEAENLRYLRKASLGPFARRDQSGAFYHEDTVAELAMIAAMNGVNVPLRAAATVVDAYLAMNSGQPPARIGRLADLELSYRRGHRSWFQAHAKAHDAGGELAERMITGQPHDRLVIVLDSGDVAEWALNGWGALLLPAGAEERGGPLPLGQMTGWQRGGQPEFFPYADRLATVSPDAQTAFESEQRSALQRALRDACATLSVNLSLSIRRAFAAIYAHRKATGGPLWPSEVTS